MDRKAWVLRAVEALGQADLRAIAHYLEDEGEPFARKELEDTLALLLEEGKLEEREGVYRLRRPSKAREAFEGLFRD